MSLQPVYSKFEDPRDALEACRKTDLLRYARENGVKEVTEQMPAILIRRVLRRKGLTRPNYRRHILGFPEPRGDEPAEPLVPDVGATGVQSDAEDDLMRQYMAQQPANDPSEEREAEAAPVQPKKEANPGFKELTRLRMACKARGIKMTRKDNAESLRAKLGIGAIVDGQDTD